ncbi:DUF3173 family protein [Streptococcus suis]
MRQEMSENHLFKNRMVTYFDNRRLGIAPAEIVEQLIGIPLSK